MTENGRNPWGQTADKFYFFLNDHLGTPRVVMDDPSNGYPEQKVVSTYTYYPFGETLESWVTAQSAFKFTGKELDDESAFGYHYFGSRYYDPELGRFASIDKAGQFASGYAYGGNSPLMGIDRDGDFLETFLVILIYGAGAMGGLDALMDGGNFFDFMDGFTQGAFVGTQIAMTVLPAPMVPITGMGHIVRTGMQRAVVAGFHHAPDYEFFREFGKGALQGFLSASRVFGQLTGSADQPANVGQNLLAQAVSTTINSGLVGTPMTGIGPLTFRWDSDLTMRDFLKDNSLSLLSNGLAITSSLAHDGKVRFSKRTLSFEGYPFWKPSKGAAVFDASFFNIGSGADKEEYYHVWQSRTFGVSHTDFWPSVAAQLISVWGQKPSLNWDYALHYNFFETDAECCPGILEPEIF